MMGVQKRLDVVKTDEIKSDLWQVRLNFFAAVVNMRICLLDATKSFTHRNHQKSWLKILPLPSWESSWGASPIGTR